MSEANKSEKSSVTSSSNFSLSSCSTNFPIGDTVECKNLRKASRLAVPSPLETSSTGTPQEFNIDIAASDLNTTSDSGGFIPNRLGCQSCWLLIALPVPCHSWVMEGTSAVCPARLFSRCSSPVLPLMGSSGHYLVDFRGAGCHMLRACPKSCSAFSARKSSFQLSSGLSCGLAMNCGAVRLRHQRQWGGT